MTSDTLQESWNSFSQKRAGEYLKTFGHPSISSKKILTDLLKKEAGAKTISIIDIGCGNAQLYEYFKSEGLSCTYTGVDFSEALLDAARKNNPEATFISDDVNTLEKVTGTFDIAIYSHTIEMLSSPESSLLAARRMAKKVFIRFFEPPVFEVDTVELKMMETAENIRVPYLRHKMSRDYYDMILKKMGSTGVEIHKDPNSKDQIHIVNY